MSFLKNIFKKDQPKPRQLNHPQHLHVKDIIVFSDSFALPAQLRAQQYEVTAINTYEFEHKLVTEWVLKGNQQELLYLSLDIDDNTYLKLSLKLDDSEVEQLFDLNHFAEIFDEPGQAFLDRKQDTINSEGWTCEQYKQTHFAQLGYFHRSDHRIVKPSQYEGKNAGEQFEFYSLVGSNDQYSLDLEVWSDGDTDVFVNLFRPLTDIIDYFPGA